MAAFRGCRYVFHCASPFFIEAADPQVGVYRHMRRLVQPAVDAQMGGSRLAAGMYTRSCQSSAACHAHHMLAPRLCKHKQAELVDPAVRGTQAVMAAAAANKADVRRVVLTSSCAGELVAVGSGS